MLKLTHAVIDIAIVCSDFDQSLRFYHELLGLEIALDIELPGETARATGLAPRGFRQVRLRAGETLIKLMQIDAPPPARTGQFQAGVRWLTFLVEDLPKTVAALAAKGVEFVAEPQPAPDVQYLACAKAPDGILIELVQV